MSTLARNKPSPISLNQPTFTLKKRKKKSKKKKKLNTKSSTPHTPNTPQFVPPIKLKYASKSEHIKHKRSKTRSIPSKSAKKHNSKKKKNTQKPLSSRKLDLKYFKFSKKSNKLNKSKNTTPIVTSTLKKKKLSKHKSHSSVQLGDYNLTELFDDDMDDMSYLNTSIINDDDEGVNSSDHDSEGDGSISTPIGPITDNTNMAFTNYVQNTDGGFSRTRTYSCDRSLSNRSVMSPQPSTTVSKHGRNRSNSINSNNDNNNALLKRLKSENKELRKSRNSLRKDCSLLKKIESKLRHKLDIILRKFKQISFEFGDDNTDWNKLQKTNDIEGVFDALFTKFNLITDSYLKRERIWKQQQLLLNKFQKKWVNFKQKYLNNNNSNNNKKKKNKENDIVDDIFNILPQHFDNFQDCNLLITKLNNDNQSVKAKLKQQTMRTQNYQRNNKKQQTQIDALANEILVIEKQNKDLTDFKNENLQIQSLFKEKENEFQTKLRDNCRDFDNLKQEHLLITSKLKSSQKDKMNQINKYNELNDKYCRQNDDILSLNSRNDKLLNDISELNKYHSEYLIVSNKLKKNQDELKLIKIINKQLKDENNGLNKFKDDNLFIGIQLKENQQKVALLQEENDNLKTKEKELNNKCNKLRDELNDKINEMDTFKDEYKLLFKKNLKTENDNSKVIKQNLDLSKQNADLNEKLKEFNKDKCDNSTQTDAAFILENAHLKALESDNLYLMKELNFLIAQRSRFNDCLTLNDFHRGDISSIVVSPINYTVITGGKHDNAVRIWEPENGLSGSNNSYEMKFIPKKKAFVDGKILSVDISNDGILLAAGCSLKNTPNGYIVVWDLSNDAKVLCNLRSRSLVRFGKVHCVKFLKYVNSDVSSHKRMVSRHRSKSSTKIRTKKNKNKNNNNNNGRNYLLFGGDTTGCILVWNLLLENVSTPICIINGHTDIIYDLSIINKKWLISVSHDQTMHYLNINGFENKKPNDNDRNYVDYCFSKTLFKDDSKYPLKSIEYNKNLNQLIFGSRKCNMFTLNDNNDDQKTNLNNNIIQFMSKASLNTKDLDHIENLRIRKNLLIIQRTGTNYVKVFNLDTNKVIKNYQIDDDSDDDDDDDIDNNNIRNKTTFKIYDCGITYDKKYAVLCVGVLNKENISNLDLNRSALKAFKIPKSSKKFSYI